MSSSSITSPYIDGPQQPIQPTQSQLQSVAQDAQDDPIISNLVSAEPTQRVNQ
jgi:hypothetical protein